MPSLMYHADEYARILERMQDDEIPDGDSMIVTWLEKLEEDINNKVDGYVHLIREFKDRKTICSEEAARLLAKTEAWQRKEKWLKDRLMAAMQRIGAKRITTATNNVSVCGNGGKQPIEIIGKVTPEYIMTVTEERTDTDKIRLALESGKDLAFAELKERGQHLRIT